MTDRERFDAMMGYGRPDRACVYYFGQWEEARQRWLTEGLGPDRPIADQVGMDPEWEDGMWEQTRFEFAYIFEDCCGKSGPLFSPAAYRQYYHKYYVKLVEFYKSQGVKYVLLDSDGDCELLIPCWLDSGIDIIFPIEVGTWNGDPVRLRQKYGKRLRMMGGVDKHLITGDPRVLRTALERLKPVVDEGGYIPLPDHRIPPNCSLDQFKAYVAMFKSVFNNGANA